MASTIKLKNGSGAPTAGDLVQGEPALDLTNKRLYTEDSGGTVLEIGTNPTSVTTGTFTSTGIDDNATSTAITIDSNENVGIGTSSPTQKLHVDSGEVLVKSAYDATGTTDSNIYFATRQGGDWRNSYIGNTGRDLTFATGGTGTTHTNATERLRIDSSGNVGIGTSSPKSLLDLASDEQSIITLSGTASNAAGATLGGINFYNADGSTNGPNNAAKITAVASTSLGADAELIFSTRRGASAGDDALESMRIDSSGNVGIGTSSPSSDAKLHVDGTDTVLLITEDSEGEATLRFGDTQAISTQAFDLAFKTGGTTELLFKRNNSTVGRWMDQGFIAGQSNAASPYTLIIANNDSTKAGAALRETGYLAAARYQGEALNLNRMNNDGDIAVFRKDGTTVGSIGNSGTLLNINGTGGLIFSEGGTEAMRIDSSGNLLVGTSSNSIGNTGFKINPVGFARIERSGTGAQGHLTFTNANGDVGSVTTGGSTTYFNTSSDQRLKENIADANDAGDKIDAIQVRQYDWKADGSHQDYGMIAQELMTVAPEAVSGDPESDEMMGVDYSKLVPMLIKEVQSLRARVAQLETGV